MLGSDCIQNKLKIADNNKENCGDKVNLNKKKIQ